MKSAAGTAVAQAGSSSLPSILIDPDSRVARITLVAVGAAACEEFLVGGVPADGGG
ncbi:MAG: hypothetical protein ACRENK_06275 [Gemmatimonadaceae bacterium]